MPWQLLDPSSSNRNFPPRPAECLLPCPSIAEATGPIDLTPENFDASTANSKAAFVKFMAPWCGHCQTMAKAWSDLATKVHSEYKGVTIGTVNCDTQKEFCAMFEIQGLPTVRATTPDGAHTPSTLETQQLLSTTKADDAFYSQILRSIQFLKTRSCS